MFCYMQYNNNCQEEISIFSSLPFSKLNKISSWQLYRIGDIINTSTEVDNELWKLNIYTGYLLTQWRTVYIVLRLDGKVCNLYTDTFEKLHFNNCESVKREENLQG